MSQIDLVPTLSLLLGIPIPFNNLGTPIEEAFVGANGQDWGNLATVNRLTAAQIHRYQHEYAQARGLDGCSRASAKALWDAANAAWSTTSVSKKPSHDRWKEAYFAFLAYERETLSICRALWASFDVPRMLNGVTILAFTLIVLGVYARGLQGDRSELTPVLLFRGAIGTALGALLGVATSFANSSLSREHTVVFATALGGVRRCNHGFLVYQAKTVLPTSYVIVGLAQCDLYNCAVSWIRC